MHLGYRQLKLFLTIKKQQKHQYIFHGLMILTTYFIGLQKEKDLCHIILMHGCPLIKIGKRLAEQLLLEAPTRAEAEQMIQFSKDNETRKET